MQTEYSSELHRLIMEFLPGFHRNIHPIVNESSYKDSKLNENQIKIIAVLNFENRPLSPGIISKILNIQKGSLTRMINSLEKIKLVSRKNDKSDDRKQYIFLTDEGRTFFEKHLEQCDQDLNGLFKEMDSGDRSVVVKGLKTLNNYLKDKGFEK